MPQLEDDIKQINASLKQVGDNLKAHAERTEKEVKAGIKMAEETRASVDQLLTEQGGLKAQLQAAEQALATLQNGGSGNGRPQTLGEKVINNEALMGFNPNLRGAVSVKIGSIHAAVSGAPDSAGSLIQPTRVPGIVAPPQQRLFVRDLLNWGTTVSPDIEFVRETGFTNNAEVVAENPTNPKPQSEINFELDSGKVATIAHWIKASKQVLSDVPMLQAYIDGRLIYGLKLKEEAQLLKGSGVGLNISGIWTQASAYLNPGVVVQNETMLDRLRIAMLQAELAEYVADGIVLNPIDWTQIELTKTTDNAYLFATPHGLAVPGLWGRPVVSSQSMTKNDFLTGAFALGAQGWDREDANISVSNQDGDNFTKNMVTILAEERVGLSVFRPEAFIKGNFTGVSPQP